MALQILIRRDNVANFIANSFKPSEGELVAAYDPEGERVIFKLGDGKSLWIDLPEITKISDLSTFSIYTGRSKQPVVEMFLDPRKITEVLTKKEITEDMRVSYEEE